MSSVFIFTVGNPPVCYHEHMQTAVVTGVSHGIGKATAQRLLAEGYKVYGLSRSRPGITNDQFVWLQCDLRLPDEIAESLQAISEPVIDVLVSNAGVVYLEMASEATTDSYERTFEVNVLAPILLVGELRNKMQQATIISVSSLSDRFPDADIALYCSSKAANTMYFNSLAEELVEARIYTLLPDYVDTPMLRTTLGADESFDWSVTITASDVAGIAYDLIAGVHNLESGSNIIIVTEKLTDDLQSVEKLYAYNADTKQMAKL